MYNFFIGVDISLIHSGLVILDPEGNLIISKIIKTKKSKDLIDYDLEKRILYIRDNVTLIREYPNSLIVTEEVLWTSRGQGSKQLGALQIYLRTTFCDWNIDFKLVFPSTLKKITTGKGNADKHEMISTVANRWNFITKDDNLADAYAMARHAMSLQSPSKS